MRCPLEMANLPYISADPNILGGQPCFANTNTPIDVLFVNLAAGERLDVIIDCFPGVSRKAAVAILRDACRLVREHALEGASVPVERRLDLGAVMNNHDWDDLSDTESSRHYRGRAR